MTRLQKIFFLIFLVLAPQTWATDSRLFQALMASETPNGRNFIVLTSGVAANDGRWTGNLGGLAGANAKCLADLSKYDWYGKNRIQSLNSQNVKALICDAGTCQNPPASRGYVFSVSNSVASGGASLYIDGSGQGPTIDWDAQLSSALWSSPLYFGVSLNWWSGRAIGTDTLWSLSPHANTCTSWTSQNGGVNGRIGSLAGSPPTGFWSGGNNTCDLSRRLVCFVTQSGTDDDPTAFDFTDHTAIARGAVVETSSVVTGFDGSLIASVMVDSGTTRQLRKNSTGSWSSNVEVSAGDTLNLRVVAATTPITTKYTQVTLGAGTADHAVLTVDDQPDALAFTNVWGATQSTLYSTSIVPTGYDVPVPASVSGGGAQISTDNATWVTSLTITPAQTLYLRMTSSATAGAVLQATVLVGGVGVEVTGTWDVMNARDNILVMTNTTWNGNLGGLAGANTKCLDEISASGNNYDFQGKPGTTIDATTVKAYLCDGVDCNTHEVSKTYYFATANNMAAGGASYTTNTNGQGPGNGTNWSGLTRFNLSLSYWSGRDTGSASLWSNLPDPDHCLGWTSSVASDLGKVGDTTQTDQLRWSSTTNACSSTRRLLCIITKVPSDDYPNPVVFTDVENTATSTQYTSNTVTLTGFNVPISVSVSGASSQLELNASGSWVTSATGVVSGDTVRIRATSSATAGQVVTATFNAGTMESDWKITNYRENLLVATQTVWTGNLGGLAGADAKCLDELTVSGSNYDFLGKTGTTLNSTTVKAFLCDGTSCNHPDVGETYWTAVANNRASGGTSFVTNSHAQGPNNSTNWNAWTMFQGVTGAWTGREQGSSATLWSIRPGAVNHCTNWSDGLGSGSGRAGFFNSTLANRWSDTADLACNSTRALLCIVTGAPQTPNVPTAFSFATTTNAIRGNTYETSTVVAGFTGSLTATAQGGGALLRVNGAGGWLASVTVTAGDTLNVQMVASAADNGTATTTVMVGTRAASWLITNLPVIMLTSGVSWTVPADWNSLNNSIECIGGGGHGSGTGSTGGGGGGGAYSKIINLALTPGASVSYQIGAAGGAGVAADSWFSSTATLLAKGGVSATTNTGAFGGFAASGVGTTLYSGGNGGNAAGNAGGGGGGGAAGNLGDGKNGGSASNDGGGGGGGNGGGTTNGANSTTAAGGNGGHNASGTGGGTRGTSGNDGNDGTNGGGGGGGGNDADGGNGGAGTDLSTLGGSGGGGGGSGKDQTGGSAGNYGGGGGGQGGSANRGLGAPGVCIIRYIP